MNSIEALLRIHDKCDSEQLRLEFDTIRKDLDMLDEIKTALMNGLSGNDTDTIDKIWEIIGDFQG